MIKTTVISTVLGLCLAFTARAAILEVGSGHTYATIQAGINAAVAGDIINVHAGRYHENASFSSSGTAGQYITLQAADGEEVIMDGASPLVGWTKCASAAEAGGNPNWQNIWYTTTATMIPVLNANVYEGDQLLRMGQSPEPADPFFDRQSSEFKSVPSSGYTATTIVDPVVFTSTEDDAYNGSLIYMYARPNYVYGLMVNDYDGSSHKVTYNAAPEGFDAGYDKYAFANHLSLMDEAGTYTYHQMDKKLFVWPLNTASLEDSSIRMSTLSRALYVSSKEFIKIDGLKFDQYMNNAIQLRQDADGCIVQNCEFYHGMSSSRADVINYLNSDDGFIYNNSVHDNKNCAGITMDGGSNNIMAGNTLDRNGATGLKFYHQSGSHMLNNYVTNHIGVHANGLTAYLDNADITVAGNQAYDGNSAFTYQEVNVMIVKNNIFHSTKHSTVAN